MDSPAEVAPRLNLRHIVVADTFGEHTPADEGEEREDEGMDELVELGQWIGRGIAWWWRSQMAFFEDL